MSRGPRVETTARARGIATRLVRREDLEALAGLAPAALPAAFAQAVRPHEPVPASASAAALEGIARRTAAARVRQLRAWAREDEPVLEAFDAEQDRRSLRALLRGALAGAPAEVRLAGLVATPSLPPRALAALSGLATPAAIAAELVLLSHPAVHAILPLVRRAQPETFALELALARHAAQRARDAARRGDANLRAHVARRIDVANAAAALLAAGSGREDDPPSWFVEGGRELSREAFAAACGAPSSVAAAARLERALTSGPLAEVARAAAGGAGRLERAALEHELRVQRQEARRDPLGSATTLSLLLRLEAQARDLAVLARGAELAAPPAALRAELVTPWT